MQRIDLDDLPPRLAQLLLGLGAGEEVLLVRGGAVEGRLTAGAPAPADAEAAPSDPERMGEIMEQFRSMIEDEF